MKSGRRNFLKNAVGAGAALLAAPALATAGHTAGRNSKLRAPEKQFRLKYAPYLDMFQEHAGKDPLSNISFCADMGFRAVFDNGLPGRPAEEQNKITALVQKLGLELGPYVLYADFSVTSFVINTPEVRQMLAAKMKEGVELLKRTGAKWALVVPGRYDEKLHRDFQTANVIDNLRFCCDIIEPAGLTIVIEPLNTFHDHPGLFLNGIPQAYQICRAVNRPSCKMLNDIYHQQITEGNIIPNMDAAWNEIATFHLGDNPGRQEPGTGEINFRNIFKHIHDKGYQGVLCMEHGKSRSGKEGEVKLIEAYREADSF